MNYYLLIVILKASDNEVHILVEFLTFHFWAAQLAETLQIENIYNI